MIAKIENGIEEGIGLILSRYPDAHILIQMTAYNKGVPIYIGDEFHELSQLSEAHRPDTCLSQGSNLWPDLPGFTIIDG